MLISCSKDLTRVETNEESGREEIKKNQLIKNKFNSLLEFDNYINSLYSLSSKEINDLSDNVTYEIEQGKVKEIQTYSSRASNNSTYVEPLSRENLSPDPYFRATLDEKNSVEVNNIKYRLTQYGTYIYDSYLEEKVDSILFSNQKNNTKLSIRNRKIKGEESSLEADFYLVSSGIKRYDTYRSIDSLREIGIETYMDDELDSEIEKPGAFASNKILTYSSEIKTPPQPLADYIYESFSNENYDSRTWAGNIIQGLIGRTKGHTQDFSNRDRVRVNFYSVNTVIYNSTGIKVKMQRKGWTQIWRQQNAEALRVGWDGLILTFKMDQPVPGQPTAVPKIEGLSKIDFPPTINFNSFVYDLTGWDMNKNFIDYDLSNLLNKTIKSSFNDAIKQLWEFVYKNMAPGSYQYRQGQVKAFTQMFPDKHILVLGRYEEEELNTSKIDKVLFRTPTPHIQMTVFLNPEDLSMQGNPKFKAEQKIEVNIEKAAMFGAAKFNNTWKGVRVSKL